MSDELKGALAILATFACILAIVAFGIGLIRAWYGF